MGESVIEPELHKYIEEQLAPFGGMFGEQVLYESWIEATTSLKSKSFNKRAFVVGKYRLLVVKKGKFGKSVINNVHLYNIVEIAGSETEDEKAELKFYSDNEKQNEDNGIIIKAYSKSALIALIKAVRFSYSKITVGFPEKYLLKLNVTPDRLEALPPLQIGLGNGLLEQYSALSHYYKTKVTLDFVRYVEALVANKSTDLDLTECPGIDPGSEIAFNLFTAIVCLRHNTYFRSVRLSHVPHINIVNAVGMVLETNRTISKIELTDLLTEQSFVPIGKALATNSENILSILNLSKNRMGFQSLGAICDGLSKLTHGLTHLDLSRCDIPPKGIEMIFQTFERNFGMSLTLEHLDLSYNRFSDTGSIALASWLSKAKGYNSLASLNLSNTQLNFNIMGPPLRVMSGLEELDLSRNPINKIAAKLIADALECVPSLVSVDLSHCKLGWEAAEELFQGLARNKALSSQKGALSLSLQHNDLGSKGGLMVARALPQVAYLGSLNLANNKIGAKTLVEFAMAMTANKWLHTLDLSRNVSSVQDSEAFCIHMREYVTSHPNLTSLSLAGSARYGMGKTLYTLIESLRNNTSLLHLDLSESNLGDVGASLLAETLRENTTLTSLHVMRNGFTIAGWQSLLAPVVFKMNTIITSLPTPLTHPPPSASSNEPFTNFTGEKRDSLLDLFSRTHYRLLVNSKEPIDFFAHPRARTKLLLNTKEPIETAMRAPSKFVTPTEVVPLADVPEHLSALAPPPSNYAVPYSPTYRPNLADHNVSTNDTAAHHTQPTSAADWAADESWEEETDAEASDGAVTGSEDEYEEENHHHEDQKKKEKEEKEKQEREDRERRDREEKDRREREKRDKEDKERREREDKEKKDRDDRERYKEDKERREREDRERRDKEDKERREREDRERDRRDKEDRERRDREDRERRDKEDKERRDREDREWREKRDREDREKRDREDRERSEKSKPATTTTTTATAASASTSEESDDLC